MKKGFTLVELLGVLVVIGLIIIVSFTFVPNIIKSNADKDYDRFLKDLYLAAESYVDENDIDVDNEYDVTIQNLVYSKLITDKKTNPKTKQNIKLTDYIKVTYTLDSNGNKKYNYEYVES